MDKLSFIRQCGLMAVIAFLIVAGYKTYVGAQQQLEVLNKARDQRHEQALIQQRMIDRAKIRLEEQNIIVLDRKYRLINNVVKKYNVDEELVAQVVAYAVKHERKTFPRAEHLVAIIGIESSWRPHVRSNLVSDPAVGLTQIRPGIWRDKIKNPAKLLLIENQVKYSIEILEEYYKKTRSRDATIIAYNVGITAFREQRYTENYLMKFRREFQTVSLRRS